MASLIAKVSLQATDELMVQIKQHLRAAIRPPPRWCPERLWLWCAARFVRLEYLNRS